MNIKKKITLMVTFTIEPMPNEFGSATAWWESADLKEMPEYIKERINDHFLPAGSYTEAACYKDAAWVSNVKITQVRKPKKKK